MLVMKFHPLLTFLQATIRRTGAVAYKGGCPCCIYPLLCLLLLVTLVLAMLLRFLWSMQKKGVGYYAKKLFFCRRKLRTTYYVV